MKSALATLILGLTMCCLMMFISVMSENFVSDMEGCENVGSQVQSLQKCGDKAFEKKNYTEALRHYNEALEIDEANSDALGSRAAVYLEMSNYVLAQQDVEKLLLLQPHHPQVDMAYQTFKKASLHTHVLALFLNNYNNLFGSIWRLRTLS